MAKKQPSAKADAKKHARQAAAAAALALQAKLRAARAAAGLHDSGGDAADQPAAAAGGVHLRYYRGDALPPPLLAWAFALTKRNMQAMYEACPRWGWNDGRKRGELEDGDTRVIVAAAAAGAAPPPLLPPPAAGPAAEVSGEGAALRNDGSDPAAAAAAAAPRAPLAGDPGGAGTSSGGVAPGAPLAFVSLRFEAEGDEAVLYVYELQVEGAAQGAGLGRLLMAAAEREARRHGMARVMLTVFQGNAAARAMYLKLGYVRDEGSPAGESYTILTKRMDQAAAPSPEPQA